MNEKPTISIDSPKRLGIFTIEELAKELGLSKWCIYRWSSERRIKAIKLGGRLRFRLRDVEAFLSKCTQEAQAEYKIRALSKTSSKNPETLADAIAG